MDDVKKKEEENNPFVSHLLEKMPRRVGNRYHYLIAPRPSLSCIVYFTADTKRLCGWLFFFFLSFCIRKLCFFLSWLQEKTCRKSFTPWRNKRLWRWRPKIRNKEGFHLYRWAVEDRLVSTARRQTLRWVRGKESCWEARAPTRCTPANRARCAPSTGGEIRPARWKHKRRTNSKLNWISRMNQRLSFFLFDLLFFRYGRGGTRSSFRLTTIARWWNRPIGGIHRPEVSRLVIWKKKKSRMIACSRCWLKEVARKTLRPAAIAISK